MEHRKLEHELDRRASSADRLKERNDQGRQGSETQSGSRRRRNRMTRRTRQVQSLRRKRGAETEKRSNSFSRMVGQVSLSPRGEAGCQQEKEEPGQRFLFLSFSLVFSLPPLRVAAAEQRVSKITQLRGGRPTKLDFPSHFFCFLFYGIFGAPFF